MLKRWRVSFEPSQDYFHHRHLWVLLPSLPLHLWNEKSLEAIGNTLGCFISVDKEAIVAPVKMVAKVLVELDIHEGLLESIDIEWRGHHTRQKLDYLGIPFRCTLCRQTGHLRKHCTDFVEEELSEDSLLELSTRIDSPEVNTHATYPDPLEAEDSMVLDSISGKLKLVCPTLYSTLTSWEKEQLDTHSFLAPDYTPPLREDTSPLLAPSCPPSTSLTTLLVKPYQTFISPPLSPLPSTLEPQSTPSPLKLRTTPHSQTLDPPSLSLHPPP
jgi:hypothetical protein